jgi:hypothetical protein
MDFARFIQLLESRQLWFSRADQFDDPLEGTLTDGEWHAKPVPDGWPQTYRYIYGNSLVQMMRNASYVSCWRMGSSESLAMWDLYGKGSGIVAVTSTVGRLKQQFLNEPRQVFMAQVQYVDWTSANVLLGGLTLVARKDDSYAHEAEMRAFIWDTSPLEGDQYLHPEHLPAGVKLFH